MITILNFRQNISNILNEDEYHPLSKPVNLIIIFVIIITIISIILGSVPSLQKQYQNIFKTLDFISMIIFVSEYILRIWVAPDTIEYKISKMPRVKYIFSTNAIVDLLAILPFILSVFSIDLRFLRVIRLLRIFKLTKYNSTITMLLTVIRNESKAFLAAFFILFIMLIIASSGIYLIENKEQPEHFGSIPESMWWAMITLTTVGYGDVTPITALGKFFGGIVTLIGVGIVALPAGILASGFSEQLQAKKKSYRQQIKQALEDNIISQEEYADLKKLQEQLDISDEDAKLMLNEQISNKDKPHSCPHCGENL